MLIKIAENQVYDFTYLASSTTATLIINPGSDLTKYKTLKVVVRVHSKALATGTLTVQVQNVWPFGAGNFPDTSSATTVSVGSTNVNEMGVATMSATVGPFTEVSIIAAGKANSGDALTATLSIGLEAWET